MLLLGEHDLFFLDKHTVFGYGCFDAAVLR